jgi:hypothetical protein
MIKKLISAVAAVALCAFMITPVSARGGGGGDWGGGHGGGGWHGGGGGFHGGGWDGGGGWGGGWRGGWHRGGGWDWDPQLTSGSVSVFWERQR